MNPKCPECRQEVGPAIISPNIVVRDMAVATNKDIQLCEKRLKEEEAAQQAQQAHEAAESMPEAAAAPCGVQSCEPDSVIESEVHDRCS